MSRLDELTKPIRYCNKCINQPADFKCPNCDNQNLLEPDRFIQPEKRLYMCMNCHKDLSKGASMLWDSSLGCRFCNTNCSTEYMFKRYKEQNG